MKALLQRFFAWRAERWWLRRHAVYVGVRRRWYESNRSLRRRIERAIRGR